MITQFKIYENNEIIEGYVIVEPSSDRFDLSKSWRTFLKSNIGKIISGDIYEYEEEESVYKYSVCFKILSGYATLTFTTEEIIDHSKNREDLEYIEQAKKYNL